MTFQHDIVIVGSGLAGLRAAMEIAPSADVALITKVYPTRSHSGAAEGGMAVVVTAQNRRIAVPKSADLLRPKESLQGAKSCTAITRWREIVTRSR